MCKTMMNEVPYSILTTEAMENYTNNAPPNDWQKPEHIGNMGDPESNGEERNLSSWFLITGTWNKVSLSRDQLL